MYLFFCARIIKESSFTILSRSSMGNLPDIFMDFPGQQKIQDFSRMWQPYYSTDIQA